MADAATTIPSSPIEPPPATPSRPEQRTPSPTLPFSTIDDDEPWNFCDEASDTTSVPESVTRGMITNGRRYQTVRPDEYWGPCDEKQFAAMDYMHDLLKILDNNWLFCSPVENPHRILDIGTGTGKWAIDVADRIVSAVVHGADLYPPPKTMVPPNCIFVVDDVLKKCIGWNGMNLIHARCLLGAFTPRQWRNFYNQAYKNLVSGGWFEQVEPDIKWVPVFPRLLPERYHTVEGKWDIEGREQCLLVSRREL